MVGYLVSYLVSELVSLILGVFPAVRGHSSVVVSLHLESGRYEIHSLYGPVIEETIYCYCTGYPAEPYRAGARTGWPGKMIMMVIMIVFLERLGM